MASPPPSAAVPASSSSGTAENAQLQIRFVTKQEQYSVPDTPFAVPSTITTTQLNTLVLQLLKESSKDWAAVGKKRSFDFLAGGVFIRTALGEHIASRDLSSEAVLDVEYLERLPAPQPKDCLSHDDWVSSVHHYRGWILTGSYDNTLHLWNSKGEHRLTIPGHAGPVKAVAWVSTNSDSGLMTFVSGSHDQTALLWEWNVDKNVVECVHVCKGHARSIECIGVNTTATRFATGGFDTLLKIWSTSTDYQEEEEDGGGGQEDDQERDEEGVWEAKRVRTDGNRHHKKSSQLRSPVMTLLGHKESLSGLCWTGENTLVTSSWDHTLRLWDVERATGTMEISGQKCFYDVHASPVTGMFITASADRHVRLYDPRSSEGNVVKASFSSHTQWVQCVRWSSNSEHHFMSGGNDTKVKLWDTRSTEAPLYDLRGHEDVVLCCDWSDPGYMMSGGSDNTLRIYKAKLGATLLPPTRIVCPRI